MSKVVVENLQRKGEFSAYITGQDGIIEGQHCVFIICDREFAPLEEFPVQFVFILQEGKRKDKVRESLIFSN